MNLGRVAGRTDATGRRTEAVATTGGPTTDPSIVALVGWSAVATAIVVFWLPKLGFGWMTDEFLTVWVTDEGLGETIARAEEFQGNSPLYFVIVWVWRQLVGSGEVALRLPTVAASIAAVALTARFGRELAGRGAGVVAAVVLVGSTNLVVRATTARPYGFLLLFAVLSSRSLWRWLAQGRRRDGVVWVVALVAVVAMSPLAIGLGAAHLVWIADARNRGRLPAGFGVLLGVGVVASLPMVPQFLALGDRRASLVVSTQPTIDELLVALVPVTALVVVGIVAVTAGLAAPGAGRGPVDGAAPATDTDPSVVRALLAWSAIPPVVVFLLGAVGESPVWVDRYLVAGLPGGALLVGWAWSRLRPPGALWALAALAIVSLLALADYGDNQRHGWREAQQWAGAQVAGDDDVVLAQGVNLIETTDVSLLDDPNWVPYLAASVGYSDGLDLPFVILPKESDRSDEWFGRQLPVLLGHDTVVVIAGLNGVPAPDWFAIVRDALADEGYREEVGPAFSRIGVSIFRR